MTIADSDAQAGRDRSRWWESAVVYQIYPRSFADASGDGVGDLRGVIERLGHLSRLGVDAVWLSPFFRSPMADFGYDISDHTDVDPLFGSLADADELIDTAHELGLKLLVDFVPNHVSDQHPWFRSAVEDPTGPYRSWFVWRDPAPDGGPPNNWTRAFSPEPAWTLDEGSGQYFLHLFLPEQPDLNWSEPSLVDAMHQVLSFWLDRGVDGFRADVVHCIGKDDVLGDLPDEIAALPAMLQDFGDGTHEQLRAMRALLDDHPRRPMIVGETYVLDPATMATYLGHDDELHLAFNFAALHCPWRADAWRKQVETSSALLDPRRAWPTWVLSNHDVPRHAQRLGSDARARAAAVLLLTLRGTPFLYQGEELGLVDAEVPSERRVDPGGRDGCRAPIPWTTDGDHGWPTEPWLPFPPDARRLAAAAQYDDARSMFEHYRRLLHLRRTTPALRLGDQELLDAPDGVLRWRRCLGSQVIEVAINFTDAVVADAVSAGRMLGGTTLPDDAVSGGSLGPDEARIVEIG